MYNLLIACDSNYYTTWAKECIESVCRLVPWLNITVIVVNPKSVKEIKNVRYVYDYVEFPNEESKVAYYQAVRFIKCSELFPNNELVMSIDCDTLLSSAFTKDEFSQVCSKIHVQRHHKADRWMAGLVTYGNDSVFRNKLRERLVSIPLENWKYGWDQTVLNGLAKEFNYIPLLVGDWMSFGKGKGKFLTLKGNQKISKKYLNIYNKIKEQTNGTT